MLKCQKEIISSSKDCAKHPFANQNTQQRLISFVKICIFIELRPECGTLWNQISLKQFLDKTQILFLKIFRGKMIFCNITVLQINPKFDWCTNRVLRVIKYLLVIYSLHLYLYCICLVGTNWAPTWQRPFVKTKEYVWHQNKVYVGGTTCWSSNWLYNCLSFLSYSSKEVNFFTDGSEHFTLFCLHFIFYTVYEC